MNSVREGGRPRGRAHGAGAASARVRGPPTRAASALLGEDFGRRRMTTPTQDYRSGVAWHRESTQGGGEQFPWPDHTTKCVIAPPLCLIRTAAARNLLKPATSTAA